MDFSLTCNFQWQVGGEVRNLGETITIGEVDIVITAIWKTKPTDPKKTDTPDDATTPKDTPDDDTVPTTTPTSQEPEPTGSSEQPQPTDTLPEPETTNPDVPEDPHSPGSWISPDPSDDWRNQTPLEGQKTPGSIQVIQQQSAPGAAPLRQRLIPRRHRQKKRRRDSREQVRIPPSWFRAWPSFSRQAERLL